MVLVMMLNKLVILITSSTFIDTNKIGRPRCGSPICLIASLIIDRIGRHEDLLSIIHKYNKIRGKMKTKRSLLTIYHHYDKKAIFETKGWSI